MAEKQFGYVEYSPIGNPEEDGIDALKDAMLELRRLDKLTMPAGLSGPKADVAGDDVKNALLEIAGAQTKTPTSIAHSSADSRARNGKLLEEIDYEEAHKDIEEPDNSIKPQDTIDEKLKLYNEGRGFADLADEKERAANRPIVGHGGPAALQNASRGIDSLLAGIARRKAIKAGAYNTTNIWKDLVRESLAD